MSVKIKAVNQDLGTTLSNGSYWGYTGIMENKMETSVLMGYIGSKLGPW